VGCASLGGRRPAPRRAGGATGAGAMARDGGTCVGGEECVSLPVLEACARDLGNTSFFRRLSWENAKMFPAL